MSAWLLKALCVGVLLASAWPAHAQVFRCIGAAGEPVFSGEPCPNPVPAPGASGAGVPGAAPAPCVPSVEALRSAIAAAFSAHDVNRLAGLILWRGFNQGSARTTLASLRAWLRQSLTGIAIAYADGPPSLAAMPLAAGAGPAASASRLPTGLAVSTTDGTRDFGVTRSGACWWLTF